jgi:membrane-associated phospholipid phosphatase
MKINLAFILFSFLLISNSFYSQTEIDTISVRENESLRLNYKKVIIPIALLSYGIIGLESHQIRQVNSGVREEVLEHIDNKITIDDFSQYISIGSLYGLHALGIKGKNNLKDKTIILATSYLLMGLTVNSFKKTAKVERPDGSSYNSFPSGHTATAFMGAELMYQEYKDQSIWYGISGYVIAAGTGAFRMYNNRHWLTDVFAGAGIGILSAKAGYWLYPITSKWFTNNKIKKTKTVLLPFYDGQNTGFGYIKSF